MCDWHQQIATSCIAHHACCHLLHQAQLCTALTVLSFADSSNKRMPQQPLAFVPRQPVCFPYCKVFSFAALGRLSWHSVQVFSLAPEILVVSVSCRLSKWMRFQQVCLKHGAAFQKGNISVKICVIALLFWGNKTKFLPFMKCFSFRDTWFKLKALSSTRESPGWGLKSTWKVPGLQPKGLNFLDI